MRIEILATYELHGDPAAALDRARALAVEQTHEFPTELAPPGSMVSLGQVRDVKVCRDDLALATIAYPAGLVAGEGPSHELTQLLVVLFGNCSLQPGVRLVAIDLPPEVLASFPGPAFGIDGLRRLFAAPTRPFLASAIKPVGLDAANLAAMAGDLAAAGIDIVKDDQGLADQPWAPFAERVARSAEAVREANARTGGHTIYAPALNAPVDRLAERVAAALEAGAGGLLVLPGLTGIDSVRNLAREAGVPLFAHPSLLGSFVTSPTSGIAHGLLFGTLLRLAGADASIFPNHGGRFSFTSDQCLEIADGCRVELGGIRAIAPMPGGGMSLDRVPGMVDFYGRDVVLLVGGELHRGDRRANAERFRSLVEAL